MDFAAQLANLERNAKKAGNNNNNHQNSNSHNHEYNNNNNNNYDRNNNNNNNRRNRSHSNEHNTMNNNSHDHYQYRNTRQRTDSYSPSRRQAGENNNQYNNKSSSNTYHPPRNNNNNNNNNNYQRTSPDSSTTGGRYNNNNHHHQQQQRGGGNNYYPQNHNNNNNNYNNNHRGRPSPLDTLLRYGYNLTPVVDPSSSSSELTLPPTTTTTEVTEGSEGTSEETSSVPTSTISTNPTTKVPSSSTTTTKTTKIPHICLLAITIDDLPYEHIWKHWAGNYGCSDNDTNDSSSNTNNNTFRGCYVSLICHSKFPEKLVQAMKQMKTQSNHNESSITNGTSSSSSPPPPPPSESEPSDHHDNENEKSNSPEWFLNHSLIQRPVRGRGKNTLADPVYFTRRPEWGSIEITTAMIDVLKDGLRIGTEKKKKTKTSSTSSTPLPAPPTTTSTATNNNNKETIKTATVANNNNIELSIEELCELDPRFSTRRYLIAKPILKKTNHKNDVDCDDEKDKKEDQQVKNDDDTNNDFVDDDSVHNVKQYVFHKNHELNMDDIPLVDKFIYISESCIPIRTLKECCDILFPPPPPVPQDDEDDENENENEKGTTKTGSTDTTITTTTTTITPTITTSGGVVGGNESGDNNASHLVGMNHRNVSWLNVSHRSFDGTPKNKYEADQFGDIHRNIPGQYRWKADQWCLLGRTHAESMIQIDSHIKNPHHKLRTYFSHINASDEMYIPTSLALLGYLKFQYYHQNSNNNNSNSNNNNNYSNNEKDQNQNNNINNNTGLLQQTTVLTSNAGVKETPFNNMDGNNNEEDGKIGEPTGTTTDETTTPATTTATTTITNVDSANKSNTFMNRVPSFVPVLRRQVTYTDWTDGMRNPRTFTSGQRDLLQVTKRGRELGCLFARKFAYWPLGGGTSNTGGGGGNNNHPNSMVETNVTAPPPPPGYITTKQWEETIKKCSNV